MPEFCRKPKRLSPASYVGKKWYFLTLCAARRRATLTDPILAQIILKELSEQSQAHGFGVYAFCIMPDHIHMEICGLKENARLLLFVRDFKGKTATHARKLALERHAVDTGAGSLPVNRLWQPSYYEHIIRDGEDRHAIAAYIFQNPIRKGLVGNMYDWRWSGSWMFQWRSISSPTEPFKPPWRK